MAYPSPYKNRIVYPYNKQGLAGMGPDSMAMVMRAGYAEGPGLLSGTLLAAFSEVWLPAQGVTLTAGKVSAWAGAKSAITLAQVTAPGQPAFLPQDPLMNGRSSISFAGAQGIFSSQASVAALFGGIDRPFTMVSVNYKPNVGANNTMVGASIGASANVNSSWNPRDGGSFATLTRKDAVPNQVIASASVGTPATISRQAVTFDGTNGGSNFVFWLNGIKSVRAGAYVTGQNTAYDTLTVGGVTQSNVGANFFTGAIGYLAIASGVLTDSQIVLWDRAAAAYFGQPGAGVGLAPG
jgi:hypothetical protein